MHRNLPRNTHQFQFQIGSLDQFEHKMDVAQQQLGIPLNERIPLSFETATDMSSVLLNLLPVILSGAIFFFLMRRMGGARGGAGGIFSMNKSKAKLFNQETDVKVKFQNVAGMDEAKEEIMEFVKFLKEPAKYERLGAKIPKGAILSGPPGTGRFGGNVHVLCVFLTTLISPSLFFSRQVKPSLQRPRQARPASPSSASPDLNSSRCL